ncbi:MAG TPA: hypothetical protein VM692_12895 [Gammaproteobacteria bacterium]|nr:hypothetical protein [Gammaproteobacteria bacterium]
MSLAGEPPRDLVAVHLRQPDVDERDLGVQALRHLERGAAAVCRGDLVAFQLEQHRERVRCVGAVVDDENAARPAAAANGSLASALRCAASGS